jgi:DNA polymerase-1
MKALIDGDMVAHMACAANQITGDFGDGLGDTVMYDEDEAVAGACRLAETWAKVSGCDQDFIVCLSEGENFRKKVHPGYKANREGVEKPKALIAARDALRERYRSWAIPGLEADDVMGIAASRNNNFVVVSRDKDMLTIPGYIFNPDHHKRPVRIRTGQADKLWLRQAMMGDPVDGYSGIPGVGEKKAQELLDHPHLIIKEPLQYFQKGKRAGQPKPQKWKKGPPSGLWESMVSYAAKAGMTEEELIIQARLSRILRTGDFDNDTRTVMLWHPSGRKEELKLDG